MDNIIHENVENKNVNTFMINQPADYETDKFMQIQSGKLHVVNLKPNMTK